MSVRFVLVMMAYLSPVFVVRWLWPRVARPNQPLHYWLIASAALVGATAAILGMLSFAITLRGSMTADCTNVWQCDLAMQFDASRDLFLFCGLAAGGMSYVALLICRRIAKGSPLVDR